MMPGAEYPMVDGPAASTATSSPHSPWRSPVPYLYGGLAAMLGLIAISLLALACTKFSAGPEEEAGAESRDRGGKGSVAGPAGEWQGLVVVIMAGDERPTFLATLASSRAADGTTDAAASCTGSSEEGKIVECEASTQPVGSEDQVQSRRMPHAISVTPEEQEAIGRLEAMGFDRARVIEAFFACDRNEQLAVN